MLGGDKTPIEIVGVVKNVKEHGLLTPVPNMIYLPYGAGGGDVTFFVRTKRNPLDLVPAVRRELKHLDPLVPLSSISTLHLELEGSVSREHVLAILSSVMGLLALALASIGLYGVIAYSVSRETKSIGIRMALGAESSAILWNVFRRVLLLVSSGIAMGLVCVLVLSRYLTSLLYGLAPNEPMNIASAAAILCVASLLAAYFPARRVARIDPLIALRDE
jgi:ABC-type antimicrobial peptide transport system permease subunit